MQIFFSRFYVFPDSEFFWLKKLRFQQSYFIFGFSILIKIEWNKHCNTKELELDIKLVDLTLALNTYLNYTNQGQWHRGCRGGEGHGPSLFVQQKLKRETKKKIFKEETIKRLSPRLKYYCFSNVCYFILERLVQILFSVPL